MTIKRRLFISNILMIVLPIIVTVVTFFTLRVIYEGLPRAATMQKDISVVDVCTADTLLQEGSYIQIANDVSIYRSDTGEHIIVIPDDQFTPIASYDRPGSPQFGLILLLVIVFLINHALTRHISHHIMTPINTLVAGVHEISDGNLTYRIQYDKNDEFNAVCNDFNEMASRLSDMVKQRQIDERNRKELVAGISHDLKTPLTSIKGHIEGLRKGIASTPEMQEKYLSIVQSKAEDIEYIIIQLFLFSKIDIGEFPLSLKTVDIGAELDKMITELADEYRENGLAITLIEKTKDIFVSVDIVQFKNIMQNILNNSVKYSNNDSAGAEIFCRKIGDSVSIGIKDNGPGVSDEALTKIFEVFYRSDISRNEPGKGSGLGLAISSKIIERLKGSIAAENVQGGGLCVTITLPEQKGEQQYEKNIDN